MPNTNKNSQEAELRSIRNIGDKIKFPELEKGVLAILKEDYGVTE